MVGGAGLIYAALANSAEILPAMLGVMWVLGAALLAVGILGFATETVAFVNRVLPDEEIPVRPQPKPTAAPRPMRTTGIKLAPQRARDAERQFVDVTPGYLVGLFDSHTTWEADRLVADFVGKWIRVQGTVRDVSKMGDAMYVQVREDATLNSVTTTMLFRDSWSDRVSTLRRGDTIRAIGQIADADRLALRLDPCELDQSSKDAIS